MHPSTAILLEYLRILPGVVSELHPEEVVHIRAEHPFDAERHFRGEGGFAVEQVGERSVANLQDARRLRYVQAESFDDLGSYQVVPGWGGSS
jgi:hypothetical protein